MKKTKETSREQAIAWWNGLPLPEKRNLYKTYYRYNLDDKYLDRVEEIWKQEHKEKTQQDYYNGWTNLSKDDLSIIHPKSTGKQFKEFNPDLFKAYIDKFSRVDKIKAFKILMDELNIML